MKTLIKSILLAVCAILVVIGLVQNAEATIYTTNASGVTKYNGVEALVFSRTWAASLDTMRTATFKWEEFSKLNEVVGQIVIMSSGHDDGGDSISLSARYEISYDGVNWEQFTLGTDSTSMRTTLTGTAYKVTTYDINKSTHGGRTPYSRVTIEPKSTYNAAGVKVKIFAVSQ